MIVGVRFIIYIGLFAAAGALYDSVDHVVLLAALVALVGAVEYLGFRPYLGRSADVDTPRT
jgi:xanthine/uracil permease